MSRMSKAKIAELVDRIGLAKAEIAPVLEALKELETKLKALGKGEYEGTLFRCTVSEYDQTSLDTAALRADFAAAVLAKYNRTTHITKINTKAKVLAPARAA